MTATQKYQLDWIRSNSRERRYHLQAGHRKVVSLTWQNIRGTCATAEIQDEGWIYTCIGYLTRQVVVQSFKTNKTVATFKPNAGGGTLRFVDGREYTLRRAHLQHPEMLWENEAGEVLLRFNADFGFDDKSGGVQLAPGRPKDVPHDTALLMSLGWYLMVSSHLDMTLIL